MVDEQWLRDEYLTKGKSVKRAVTTTRDAPDTLGGEIVYSGRIEEGPV